MRTCRAFFLIPILALGCGTTASPIAVSLPEDDVRLAREIAEQQESLREIREAASTPAIVFVKAELVPDSRAGTGQRQVTTQHYRYRDDATVFTRVDLTTRAILQSETAQHYPTGLAEVEIRRAVDLAKSDDRLHTMIELQRLRLTPRPLQSDPASPLYGHRVVHFLLQRGHESLTEPHVLVDLTEGRVIVGETGAQ